MQSFIIKIKKISQEHQLITALTNIILLIILFRIGNIIPLPFIPKENINNLTTENSILNLTNTLSGNTLKNASLFSLGIAPFITANIIIQSLSWGWEKLKKLQYGNTVQRNNYKKIVKTITLITSIIASIAYVILLESQNIIPTNPNPTLNIITKIIIISTLTTGSMITMLLCEWINSQKTFDGTSIILLSGIITQFPQLIQNLYPLTDYNEPHWTNITNIIITITTLLIILLLELSHRNIPVTLPTPITTLTKNTHLLGETPTQPTTNDPTTSIIPIKTTTQGIMPIILTTTILTIPYQIIFLNNPQTTELFNTLNNPQIFNIILIILKIFLILILSLTYAKINNNTQYLAKTLTENGGTITTPKTNPGQETTDYINHVNKTMALLTAIILIILTITPEIITTILNTNLINTTTLTTTLLILITTSTQFTTTILSYKK